MLRDSFSTEMKSLWRRLVHIDGGQSDQIMGGGLVEAVGSLLWFSLASKEASLRE